VLVGAEDAQRGGGFGQGAPGSANMWAPALEPEQYELVDSASHRFQPNGVFIVYAAKGAERLHVRYQAATTISGFSQPDNAEAVKQVTFMYLVPNGTVITEFDDHGKRGNLRGLAQAPRQGIEQHQATCVELFADNGRASALQPRAKRLEADPRTLRQRLNDAHQRAAKLLIPLLENQSSKVVLAAIEALEQLGPLAAHQSIPALNYLLGNATNRQVKQQARTALGRLTMQSAPGTEDEAMDEASQSSQFPLYDARVSFVDGAGAQMIMIAWQRPDDLLKGVNVLYQDDWGIKDCYGADDMEVDHWEELIERMEQEGLGSYQVPLAYCRALITEARQVNKRTRHKVPVAYAVWRPSIEVEEADQKQQVETMLQPLSYTPDVALLAQRGDTLYALPEFNSWYYDPFDSLRSYVYQYSGVLNRIDDQAQRRKRKAQSKAGSSRADLEAIVTEALEKSVDTRWRLHYESRLRRQAALFVLINRTEDVQLLRAVAAMLHPDSGVPPRDQPFLRAMMHYTLENGLARLLSEMIESGEGPFGKIPLDLFKDSDDWGF